MPTGADQQFTPPPRVTAKERRYLWGASGLFFAMLLLMFFTGLFFNIRADHAFIAGFYYISEVIAACAAGIIASTITGFFKLEIEKKIGTTGRIAVQACGGFAVFLVVIYLGPRQKMQDLSSLLFSHLISDCKSSLISTRISSQSRAVCIELTRAFPSRAEVWMLLGRLEHMRDSSEGDQIAVTHFAHAIDLLGLKDPTTNYETYYSSSSKRDRIDVSELLRHYSYARGNVLIKSRQLGRLTEADYENELSKIEWIVRNAMAAAGADADADFISDAHDILGKLYFYRHFQIGGVVGKRGLDDAKNHFQQIINLPYGCNVWPKYHYFLVSAVIAEASKLDPCTNQQLVGQFGDLVLETGRCATMSGLDSGFWSNYKFILTGMFRNEREELYEITSKLGSKQFGGSAVAAFARCDIPIRKSMSQLLDRL